MGRNKEKRPKVPRPKVKTFQNDSEVIEAWRVGKAGESGNYASVLSKIGACELWTKDGEQLSRRIALLGSVTSQGDTYKVIKLDLSYPNLPLLESLAISTYLYDMSFAPIDKRHLRELWYDRHQKSPVDFSLTDPGNS